ncbi:hypothetical protein BRC91_06840 [Halobacteriales archaeon QS_4_62_28]|nr:MAG: hypothetical protein BRC91_06840 [Halobacteriales archaeon QS_4_62_28]
MMRDVSIEYDDEFEHHVVDVSGDDQQLMSELVVYAVAEISGRDPTDLQPLAGVINPDALDSIFDHIGNRDPGTAHITFEYHAYEVTIFGHGRLTIAGSN